MSGWMLSFLLLVSVGIALCDGQMCQGGDVTLTASECTDPVELFNNTLRVLPGTNITLVCSIVDTSRVNWNSSQFDEPINVDDPDTSTVESGVTFQYIIAVPGTSPAVCANATATITDIQDSMDGLDLTCFNPETNALSSGFSSTVLFDVIDLPPPVINLTVEQNLTNLLISWEYPDSYYVEPCPIIGYNITINGSTVFVTETQYIHPISASECGSTLQINVSAAIAGAIGNTTTINFPTVTPSVSTEVKMISFNDLETDTDEAKITVMINNSVLMVTNNSIELSSTSGGGSCLIGVNTSTSLGLNCTGLSASTPYILTIYVPVSCGRLMRDFEFSTRPDSTTSPSVSSTSEGPSAAPTTSTTSSPTEPESNIALIAGASVGGVVVILLTIVVVLAIIWFCFKKNTHKDDTDGPIALVEKKNPKTGQVSTYDDPAEVHVQKEVHHKEAPTGETYAIPDKQAARRAAPSTPGQFEAQDPNAIQHQQAHTGDMYAVVNTETSKPVYSEVHKPQDTRVYADLALSEGGISQPGRQPTAQEEKPVYSEVQHTKPSSPTGQEDNIVSIPVEESLYEKY